MKKNTNTSLSNYLSRLEYHRNAGYSKKSLVASYFRHFGEQFVSAFRNPVYPKANIQISDFSDVGIVFQGPLSKEYDYTINTIRYFREIYPEIKIVLSTWKNELNSKARTELEKYDCAVIEGDSFPAEDKGEGQKKSYLHNQLFSAQKGIEYLKNKGCLYVLKIRTDLRIYKQDFIPHFMNLLKIFPCKVQTQTQRLICVGYSNNLVNVPFHMSDFIWFGSVADMEKMYNAPYWTQEEISYIRERTANKEFMASHSACFRELLSKNYNAQMSGVGQFIDEKFLLLFHEEAYLASRVAKCLGFFDAGKSLAENYRDFLASSVIVVDDRDIDSYWNKYDYNLLENGRSKSDNERLTSSVWLDLFLRK